MRLPEIQEEPEGMSPVMVVTLCGVILFVVVLICAVFYGNQSEKENHATDENPVSVHNDDYAMMESVNKEAGLTPEDFDFWDMYPEESEYVEESTTEESEVAQPDPSTDGKHTLVKYRNGEEEWVMINPNLAANTYDSMNFVNHSGTMEYYIDGRPTSFFGVDLSKTQEYVDFVKLKKAGVDYCMIRLGARGYETGQIVLDDYFSDNLKRAKDAGLKVGVYFFSQATSIEEVTEEAQFVLDTLDGQELEYPVAFVMEYINNDSCRIENTTKKEKTNLAIQFLDTIKIAGYHTILYGNKEWLMKEIDLSKLQDYDIWFSQQEDLPDYPYRFTMWQYNRLGEIDGIQGTVNFNISFVDYSEK